MDDVRSPHHATVIQATSRLLAVAVALGAQRTRQELLPFLLEFSDIDNDEAQTCVAQQLAPIATLNSSALIGGVQYLHLCFPLLEKLCGEVSALSLLCVRFDDA